MPKAIFVYPDFQALGVEYLMSTALENGYQTDLVFYEAEDMYLGRKRKYVSYPEIANSIAQEHPDLVAFSCVTDNYRHQLRAARALKMITPDVVTIFGGVHPTAVPEKVLVRDEVDCVAIGESEISFAELLDKGRRGDAFVLPESPIQGLVFKKGNLRIGDFVEGRLANLDSLPFPHRAPFASRLRDAAQEYRVITSRGCPYRCTYCFNAHSHKLRGKASFRQRSVDNVIEELLRAKENVSIKHVLFLDDSFTAHRKWILKFCERYRTEIDIPFSFATIPRYIDHQVASALSSAGCVTVQIGIQSLSEELCKGILQRPSDNSQIIQAMEALRASNIMVQVDHMLGIPGDSVEEEEESLLFYSKHAPDWISVFWLTYYPKTPIVETALEQGIIGTDDVARIEEGVRMTEYTYLNGGSMKDPKPYYPIAVMLNYLPLLPRRLTEVMVRSRLYRLFKTKSFFFVTALPRFLHSISDRRDHRGRSHIVRFFGKIVDARA